MAAVHKNSPTCMKRPQAAGFARVNSIVGNIPGTTVDNERGLHMRRRIAELENGNEEEAIGEGKTAVRKLELDEEVEGEEEHAEDEEEGAEGEAALREAAD